MDPQPPAGSLFWEGKSVADGAVYERTCANGPNDAPVISTFVAEGAAATPSIDPAALAQRAVDKMKLTGPDIASPHPAGRYVVGMPMWLWVNQSATTHGPNSASATAGGVTVTATAKVSKIVWEMGDGSAVTCRGPGTTYQVSFGRQESPSCGHTYTRTSASEPRAAYTVTATATWSVGWEVDGTGEAGQFEEIRASEMQVAIGEAQVVR
jgi:hypothetical protein